MRQNTAIALMALLACSLAAVTTPRTAAAGGTRGLHGTQPAPAGYTDRLIVKFRDNVTAASRQVAPTHLSALSNSAGVQLQHLRPMSGNGQVFRLPGRMTLDQARAVAAKLQGRADVEYAVPDQRRFPLQTPDDPGYASQWNYKSPFAPDNIAGGANLPAAWAITTGSADVVAAVVDTGIVPHADLAGRTVPGYNFIHDKRDANNDVGRSADPTDLGDWITQAESAGTDPAAGDYFIGCDVSDSSWHGTHVAGTIGATSNNGTGVTGINWTSKILPVRVLGKCGGWDSDIIDGMRWAAGLAVTNVPDNANPARVINLSLGGDGNCNDPTNTEYPDSQPYRDAIDEIRAVGTVIVVAAGNNNTNASTSIPGGCPGVISVAALDRFGSRAWYSNYGTGVKIAAPGGSQANNDITDPNGILSTLNAGTTTPIPSPAGDIYGYYQGTSMATPHVTGIVSLLFSVNPQLTPDAVQSVLQTTARPFPVGTGRDCKKGVCGEGIVDAYTAISLATKFADFIKINDGAHYTTNKSVVVTSTPPGEYSHVRLSNDNLRWGSWQPVTQPVFWSLKSGDGFKIVYAQYGDGSSNTGNTYSAGISLDTRPPTGKLQLNKYAKTPATTFSISATDATSGVDSVCISELSTPCTENQFTPFTSNLSFTLSAGDGKKTVYVTLRDNAGNVSRTLKKSIILDTVPPVGTIIINGGATTTVSSVVSLKLKAPTATQMQLSVDGLTWGNWVKFASSTKVTLPPGTGTKVVQARFSDAAGNESEISSASIELQ